MNSSNQAVTVNCINLIFPEPIPAIQSQYPADQSSYQQSQQQYGQTGNSFQAAPFFHNGTNQPYSQPPYQRFSPTFFAPPTQPVCLDIQPQHQETQQQQYYQAAGNAFLLSTQQSQQPFTPSQTNSSEAINPYPFHFNNQR